MIKKMSALYGIRLTFKIPLPDSIGEELAA